MKMKPEESYKILDELDDFDKLSIYMHYQIIFISLNLTIKPKMLFKTLSFEEFKNKERNFIPFELDGKTYYRTSGIYDHYWKFADEIKLL